MAGGATVAGRRAPGRHPPRHGSISGTPFTMSRRSTEHQYGAPSSSSLIQQPPATSHRHLQHRRAHPTDDAQQIRPQRRPFESDPSSPTQIRPTPIISVHHGCPFSDRRRPAAMHPMSQQPVFGSSPLTVDDSTPVRPH
ncbi:hypothetical protein ACLOJK_037054 [Asimina triloba]